ncbi:unnamed protein product [Acanthoscelides obtectus]|uniref:Origin recognition complex subunit 2 n=1 Tax=Acanthoscelides obtectus TaxID=200917 RepID=A0A9P0L1E8_ACAOB|nr:unnamed protein product [Acanthoscelides obtectus]CAK1642306.1 Origin recognition complex subunit 2 [Acanthoscelides obtectus]
MIQKAAEVAKTPHAVRKKTKSKIEQILQEDSTSEYEISSEESSFDSDTSSSIESEDEPQPKGNQKIKITNTNLQTPRTRGRGRYTIKTEEYFENCASSKIQTSNNTLDKLQTPKLPQHEVQQLLQNSKLSKEHEKCIEQLTKINESYFKKWLFLLNENFNILLYGLGSKRNIIKKFHMEYLKDMPVIVVNGFFPALTIKNILDSIIVDLLKMNESPSNPTEACNLIIEEFQAMPETHLYLLIHNIEGDMLRNTKAQNALAMLASVRNIHLLASIDHINAPLIWDHIRLSKFNYIWFDVTCFSPYVEETSFEKSMMIAQTGALALSSLRNVFLSLTSNSKSIYLVIVKHQLEHGKNQFYQGISFKDLYMACRESFVVSSDLALRAQLTEFIDHKMVKLKRSVDGTEYLIIPLASNLLQKLLDENS